ncbi:LysR family transcriptional regulator [Methylobacterium oryzisoli]|uniref:LysR family transcriptional regulator n=1 Tax=Methylobacterium oryzisoli TaxID=3385502 RepID=UPI00389257A2
MERPDMVALAGFVAVAREGGLNAASRRTGIPKATLSRRVRDLEAGIGLPLVSRGGTRLDLTEDGRALLARAAPLLADLDALWTETRDWSGQVRGRLRVSMPVLLARFGMGELVARFVRTYPAVELEIDVNDRFVDPVSEGYDVVVRANPSPDTGLVGRLCLRTRSVLAAAPGVARPAGPDEPVDAVVLSAGRGPSTWTVLGPAGELTVTPREVLRCSSMMLVHEAVLAGAGAALLPAWLIEGDVAAGRLTAWGSVPNRDIEVWVLHPPGGVTSPKVRAFADFLVERFARSRAMSDRAHDASGEDRRGPRREDGRA